LGLTTLYTYSYSLMRQVRTQQLRIAPQRHTVFRHCTIFPPSASPGTGYGASGYASSGLQAADAPGVAHHNQQFDRASGVAIWHP
jgi:hypothetical protein